MKKRRKVKKSVIRLTKVLLAIMMIFTTFTNMPTLVRATDESGETTTEVLPQEGDGTTVQKQPAIDAQYFPISGLKKKKHFPLIAPYLLQIPPP